MQELNYKSLDKWKQDFRSLSAISKVMTVVYLVIICALVADDYARVAMLLLDMGFPSTVDTSSLEIDIAYLVTVLVIAILIITVTGNSANLALALMYFPIMLSQAVGAAYNMSQSSVVGGLVDLTFLLMMAYLYAANSDWLKLKDRL